MAPEPENLAEIDLAASADFELGGLAVSPSACRVRLGAREQRLEPRVMQVLVLLAHRPGETLTRDQLIDSCWGGRIVSDDAVNRVLSQVRAVGRAFEPHGFVLETIPRVGFRLQPRAPPPDAETTTGALAETPLPARSPRPRLPAIPIALGLGLAVAVLGATIERDRICSAVSLLCPRAAPAASASIAVLPFSNLSADEEKDDFTEGLTEEIRGGLARSQSLQVAARTSSAVFKETRRTPREIAAILKVNYILEGSVRREGDRVRVSAELVDGKSGFDRWSDAYDGSVKDVFAVQSRIADAVAQAMRVKLLAGGAATTAPAGSTDPAALDAYFQARKLFDAGAGEAGFRAALAKFDQAIAADPNFAAAHAGRARTLAAIANQFATGPAVEATYQEAMASAHRALALAPDLPEAQLTLATVLSEGELDVRDARPAFDRAIAGAGGEADVLVRYGLFATRLGDAKAGLAALRRAAVLDPLNPRVFKALGLGLSAVRRYDEAIGAFRKSLALSPLITGSYAGIATALYVQGRLREAGEAWRRESLAWQREKGEAILLRRLGKPDAARSALAAMMKDGDSASFQEAEVLAQWGDLDLAFAALDRAYAAKDSGLLFIGVDPLLDPIRRDPRFKQQLARLDLAGRAEGR